jgi:DNA modification methylase
MVDVFREVKRVLKDDGTLWLNIGDSYASYRDGKATPDTTRGSSIGTLVAKGSAKNRMASTFQGSDVKHKDLIGIPWMLAFALRADGWYLRQDIIWHKPNPMPESVKDRCTKAHEYIFLMSKSDRYSFDSDAIKEPSAYFGKDARSGMGNIRYEGKRTKGDANSNGQQSFVTINETRNKRSVWTVATKPYKGAHFATYPSNLIRPCIMAGCPIGGTVLDPFGGSGTTAAVANEEGRNAILCELNPDYIPLIQERINNIKKMNQSFFNLNK